MGHESARPFRTLHALRIRGLATAEGIAETTGLGRDDAEADLAVLAGRGWAMFRDRRALWQITADGRAAHGAELETDLDGVAVDDLGPAYASFLELNREFKALCGAWQLREGQPNDHLDADYDRQAIRRLRALHDRATPVLADLQRVLRRLAPYAPRLGDALARLEAGDTSRFTGVMCDSYHDVWMELHEDLLLTQGLDRSSEGSH